MPRVDDLLPATGNTNFMSTLDLRSGYHEIPIRQDDHDENAWTTPFGVYCFKVIHFGLRNAGATF